MLGLAVSRYFQYISGKEIGLKESKKDRHVGNVLK